MNKQKQTDFFEKPELLIVGASTRAAAFSAIRTGFQPVCVDQYADLDLREIAEVLLKTDDRSDWIGTLNQRPALDWIYTGAMENQPELIAQISQKHRLRGCSSEICNVPAIRFSGTDSFTQQNSSGPLPAIWFFIKWNYKVALKTTQGFCRTRNPVHRFCFSRFDDECSPLSATLSTRNSAVCTLHFIPAGHRSGWNFHAVHRKPSL